MVDFSMNVHNYLQQIITSGLKGVINWTVVYGTGMGAGSVRYDVRDSISNDAVALSVAARLAAAVLCKVIRAINCTCVMGP
jgi:hypothetical protein